MSAVEVFRLGDMEMPCPLPVEEASAGTVAFDVAITDAALATVADGLELVETSPGRTTLIVACVDYRRIALGPYHEVGLTWFARPAGAPADGSADGTYIWQLPVDSELSVRAGVDLWGFPKSLARIDWDATEAAVTARLEMDGCHVLTVTVPRGGDLDLPLVPMTTFTEIDGRLHKVPFHQGGAGSQVIADPEGVEIELGDHPVGQQLAAIGVADAPVTLSTWTEHMRGLFGAPEPV